MFLLYSLSYSAYSSFYGKPTLEIHGLFSTNEEALQKAMEAHLIEENMHIKELKENDLQYLEKPWDGVQEPCIDCSFCEKRDESGYTEFMAKF
jgi:hypothetical protein